MRANVLVASLLTFAHAFPTAYRDSPLSVTLERTNLTHVEALIVNKGSNTLKLSRPGTLFDASHNEHLYLSHAGNKIPSLLETSRTIHPINLSLTESSFQILPAAGFARASFAIAAIYDLSKGGDVELVAKGAFSYAEPDSTTISGPLSFVSNTITLATNGAQVAKAPHSLTRRSIINPDCQGSELQTVKTALKRCADMAKMAANNVDNRAKMTQYFKSTSSDAVDTVRRVFHRIAEDCERTMSGFANLRCVDIWNGCNHDKDYLAAAASSIDEIVVCPSFFALSPLSSTCHDIDQPGTLIHEMTHLSQVQSTGDSGGYGYNSVRDLEHPLNLKHADSYRLFAQSFFSASPEKC